MPYDSIEGDRVVGESLPEIVIESGRSEIHYWYDLWRYRELLGYLTWRDILVRYKQTVFGVAWAWLRPLLTMLVFTLVFGRLAKMPSDNLPYSVLVFVGVIPWQFFSTALTVASTSMIDNVNLISKIYFPRLLVPLSSIVVCLFDAAVAAILLAAMMAIYGVAPNWHLVFLPIFLVMAFLLAFGIGIFIAALNVRYRDFRYIVPFATQLGLYVSPVGFSSSVVPGKWMLLYSLNPMVGIIDGFRWSLLGSEAHLQLVAVAVSAVVTIVVAWVGVRYFRRAEQTFADVI